MTVCDSLSFTLSSVMAPRMFPTVHCFGIMRISINDIYAAGYVERSVVSVSTVFLV